MTCGVPDRTPRRRPAPKPEEQQMSQEPIGVESARQRGATKAVVVQSVETVGSGDLLVNIGWATINTYGELGRVHEDTVLRLTPADQARLVDLVQFAGQVAR
jgi:hypothetical protein